MNGLQLWNQHRLFYQLRNSCSSVSIGFYDSFPAKYVKGKEVLLSNLVLDDGLGALRKSPERHTIHSESPWSSFPYNYGQANTTYASRERMFASGKSLTSHLLVHSQKLRGHSCRQPSQKDIDNASCSRATSFSTIRWKHVCSGEGIALRNLSRPGTHLYIRNSKFSPFCTSVSAEPGVLSQSPKIDVFEKEEEAHSASLLDVKGQTTPQEFERRGTVGLYGYDELQSGAGFQLMANDAIARAEEIASELQTITPSPATIRLLDDISDVVCTVLDAAELCRQTHPDREYVSEAHKAFVQVSQYVQKLNTSRPLYNAVVAAIESNSLGEGESMRVASMLRTDFERGGVHLSQEKRDRVEELNDSISHLGMMFTRNISADNSSVDIFPASRLQAVPSNVHALLTPIVRSASTNAVESKRHTRTSRLLRADDPSLGLRISSKPLITTTVLKWVADSDVRKRVFIAGNSSPQGNLEVVNDLIAARHEMAQLLGYESYTGFLTSPLLAGSPQAVVSFLEDLSLQIRPKADKELKLLGDYKRQQEGGHDTIFAWDRYFYTGLAKARAHNLDAREVAAYFSLEACVEGLGLLLKALFRAEMRETAMAAGESWAPEVRKFCLFRYGEGELGYIYLDLYPRPTKYTHAAHFTIKCGRERSNGSYQLPVVALVCNFPLPLQGGPCLLYHSDTETLFHEFGHAVHSLLSRTKYQHVSGTRAALDFVEVPSHLFEYFVWDYRLLQKFARHHVTGEVIPEKIVAALRQAKGMFAAMDLQNQVVYALTDQAFFGQQAPTGIDATAVMVELQNQHSGIPHVEGTHWYTRFVHLIGYGGGYYSYLYARAFAAEMWQSTFEEDPLSSEAGELLREKVLVHGAAKDPALILRDIVGDQCVELTPLGGIRPGVEQLLKEVGI